MTDLSKLEADLTAAVAAAADVAALEAVRVTALGKSGSISELLKTLGSMSPDERRERGPLINGLRDRVGGAIAQKKAALEAAELDAKLTAETVDLTLPPPPERRGHAPDTRRPAHPGACAVASRDRGGALRAAGSTLRRQGPGGGLRDASG